MTNTDHLKIYYKLFQLTKYLYGVVNSFPKRYKYTLGEEIISLSWKCLDLVVETNSFKNKDKYDNILALSNTFDFLKVRLRMLQELGVLPKKQYVHILGLFIREIGEMIGGWLLWSKGYVPGC